MGTVYIYDTVLLCRLLHVEHWHSSSQVYWVLTNQVYCPSKHQTDEPGTYSYLTPSEDHIIVISVYDIYISHSYIEYYHYMCYIPICIRCVCWSLTSLCHSNGHIETMPAREINPFTAQTRIRSQFIRTQWSTSNHSEWTRLRLRPLRHRGWLYQMCNILISVSY